MSFANMIHSWSLKLGYDEPYDPRTIPTQTSIARISSIDLKSIMKKTPGMGRVLDYANSDENYKLVDKSTIKNLLRINPVNNRVYVPIKNDCDDYAWILMGDVNRWDSDLAFGIVWSHGHAINWFIDTNKKIWYIEPQNDVIFEPRKDWNAVRIMI